MKIGLYFGSFNPIHTGHLIIASHLLNVTPLEKVWFVLSPRNPFKQTNTLLNEYQRLHLVTLAISDDLRLKASDVEFSLPKPSYTSVTLVHLREKYPEHEFSVIMGSDSLKNLSKWKNADSIISSYQIYVYPRPGCEITQVPGANITVVRAPMLELSATMIRDQIKRGLSVRYMLPDPVWQEIEKSGYYRT